MAGGIEKSFEAFLHERAFPFLLQKIPKFGFQRYKVEDEQPAIFEIERSERNGQTEKST